MDSQQLNDLLRPLMLPDLRIECRARGINPAGGRAALLERVREHMLSSNNYILAGQEAPIQDSAKIVAPPTGNNYGRPEGQNVGNFMTNRNSSRVIQPPGGKSQIVFGGDADGLPSPVKTKVTSDFSSQEGSSSAAFDIADQLNGSPMGSPSKHAFTAPTSPIVGGLAPDASASPKIAASRGHNNNYHRSEGQNVGNFITDRNSSRVSAPPGGRSNITFG